MLFAQLPPTYDFKYVLLCMFNLSTNCLSQLTWICFSAFYTHALAIDYARITPFFSRVVCAVNLSSGSSRVESLQTRTTQSSIHGDRCQRISRSACLLLLYHSLTVNKTPCYFNISLQAVRIYFFCCIILCR